MTIQMTCACGANLSFEDAQLGQSGPCHQCGQTVTVAPASAPAASPVAAAAAAMHAPIPHNPMPGTMGADASSEKEAWAWHYSRFVGIMYGPIPVGIIIAAIVGGIYLASQ
ncbi:MAG: hypothetical protein ACI9KE_005089 [Polyangiales bacterium]|jgi:hypothetical protein